ncbi:MAG: DNA repair and recombination protein RadA, partial [Nitrososphaerales archaeon]
ALCQLPAERGGLDGGAIYIDTEGTFRAGRLEEIAESRGLDSAKILDNVLYCRTYNAPHLEMVCRSLGSHIEKNNTKVVVVDSVISLYRSEFIGRETLADRQQRLSLLIHKLHSLAEVYGIAVVITNQVVSTPNTFFGDPNKPTGGNSLGHGSTYRIQLRRSGEERTAIVVDSPCHPYSETRFTITKAGVTDTEAKKAKGE